LLLAGVLLIGAPVIAVAQEQALGGKFRSGDSVVISAGETVDGDLYATGETVRIDGTVEGDLVAAGGSVDVTGEVGGDVLAGSGTVDISGDVGGDVRVGAGDLTIAGSIGEDLLAGAGQVTITSSGTVGEDFVFGAGRVTMNGRIEGDVLGGTGSYSRGGTVGGSEDVTINEREEEPTFGDRVLGAARRFVSLLAVAALLLWLLPWSIEGTAQTLRERPAASFGFGALGLSGSIVAIGAVMIGTALLAIILGLLTLGELVVLATSASIVAIIVFVFLLVIVLAYLAPAAVGMAVAGLALEQAWATRRWLLLVLGVLVVVIVTSIPVLGGWLGFVIVVFGLGAFLLTANARRRRTQPLPPPPMPAPAS
jgi:cytoskeletal protein CcmA (bactofilin family)